MMPHALHLKVASPSLRVIRILDHSFMERMNLQQKYVSQSFKSNARGTLNVNRYRETRTDKTDGGHCETELHSP